jgi:hypothetical protein
MVGFPSAMDKVKMPKAPTAPKMPQAPTAPKAPTLPSAGGGSGAASGDDTSAAPVSSAPHSTEPSAPIGAARWLNILALMFILFVLTLSLTQQFGYGMPPSYLGILERSALIGVALGPIMNLIWGMSPQHYSVSLISALVGGAVCGQQMLNEARGTFVLDPNEVVLGLPLFDWALGLFAAAALSIALILLWIPSWAGWDHGILNHKSPSRVCAYWAIMWLCTYLVLTIIQVLYRCGVTECPASPTSSGAQSISFTFSISGSGGNEASISIPGLITVLLFLGLASLVAAIVLNHRQGREDA